MRANVTLSSKLKGISSLIKKLRGTATMANQKINGGASPYPKHVGPSAICSFSDGADGAPLKTLVFSIEPNQSGSGDPSPQNIRPISGWTQVGGVAAGKNIISPSMAEIGTAWNGTPNSARGRLVVQCKPSTKYTISMNGTSSMSNIFRQDSAVVPASSVGGDITNLMPYTFTTGASSKYIIIAFSKTGITQADVNALKLQIEEGGTNTDYENTATPITIALGQTVYGGTVDAIAGALTDTDMLIDDFSTLSSNGTSTTGAYRYQMNITGMAAYTTRPGISSGLKYAVAWNGNANTFYNLGSGGNGILVIFLNESTVDAAKQFLSDNNIVFVVPRHTPIEVDLTPVSVSSLLGQNNVWCNTGDTELDYYPAQSSVVAVWDRTRHMYVSIPLSAIRYDTYQINPQQAIDLDSYRSETGTLIRNVVGSKAKIEFNTPMMDDSQWSEVWSILSAGFNNTNEKKLKLKYYDTQSGSYKYGYFYVPDVQTPIRSIDEPNGIINYNEIRIAFIEY